MEKILDLLNRFSSLYNIPQWGVNSGAIIICVILIASPFVARYLMRPKYYKYREMFLFKVLWRWKYKKGNVIALWCYCPNCHGMLICDDENCRSTGTLQDKKTYFVCTECGSNELGRVVGGDRRYALSLVKRDIWRHIKDGTYNEVSTATKEALELYQQLKNEKESEILLEIAQSKTQEEPLHVKSDVVPSSTQATAQDNQPNEETCAVKADLECDKPSHEDVPDDEVTKLAEQASVEDISLSKLENKEPILETMPKNSVKEETKNDGI